MRPEQAIEECPALVDLSCWTDKELSDPGVEQRITQHLDVCDRCGRTVTVYRQFDTVFQTGVRPREDLAERIKQRCSQLPQRSQTLYMPSFGLRTAAVLGILFGIALLISMNGMRTQKVAVTSGADEFSPVVNSVSRAPEAQAPVGRLMLYEPKLQPSKIQNSFLATTTTRPQTVSAGVSDPAGAVDSMVTHVWVVNKDDCDRVKPTVVKALPGGVWAVGGNTVSLRVMLSDRDLQALVDFLAASGSALVSPSLPQPGKGDKTYFAGRNVDYRATFVCRSHETHEAAGSSR